MRFVSLLILTVATAAQLSAQTPARAIVLATGDPVLVETSFSGSDAARTEAEFLELQKKLATNPQFVPMTMKPTVLSERARFGAYLMLGGKNLCWILDSDAASGAASYSFIGDLNANGDLSDDPVLKFVDELGKPTLRYASRVKLAGSSQPVPITFKLIVDMVPAAQSADKVLGIIRYTSARRSAEFTPMPKSAPMKIRANGAGNAYDIAGVSSVSFDLDRDGVLDPDLERFTVDEKFVNIDGATFEFSVDRYGSVVTMTPLAKTMPARAALKTGYAAPDFQFTDLNGKACRLSEFRGKAVFLDFWGVWCGPCVAGVPELVELYEKYHARGFEILGIEANDTHETVARFIAEKKMPWPQTLEKETGPITKLYRVTGWPTAFLVGADGKFEVANYGGTVDLRKELERLFPAR